MLAKMPLIDNLPVQALGHTAIRCPWHPAGCEDLIAVIPSELYGAVQDLIRRSRLAAVRRCRVRAVGGLDRRPYELVRLARGLCGLVFGMSALLSQVGFVLPNVPATYAATHMYTPRK